MLATKIKMKPSCGTSNNLLEIDSVYLTGMPNEGFYKKEDIHNFLKQYPGNIQVDLYPYPDLIPAISARGEKYVRSEPNNLTQDNLLRLPRV